MFNSNTAQDKRKNGFSSWFAANLEEEFEPSVSNFLFSEESTTGEPRRCASSGSFKQRNSDSGDRRKSPIAVSQSTKPRVRQTPLKRNNSGDDMLEEAAAPARGRLVRMSAHNNSTEGVAQSHNKSNRSLKSSLNEASYDGRSAQSSITNSWAPKLRLHHPPPYQPRKPLENMVITVKSNLPGDQSELLPLKEESSGKGDDSSTALSSSHSAIPGESFKRKGEMLQIDSIDEHDESKNKSHGCLQSLVLTEEQQAEADAFVFKGWGGLSDDGGGGDNGADDDCLLQNDNFNGSSVDQGDRRGKSNKSWFFKRKEGPASRTTSSADDSPLERTEPQSIEDAMRELQELTGMQVKCLDGSGGVLVKEDDEDDSQHEGAEGRDNEALENENDLNGMKNKSQHASISQSVDEEADHDRGKQLMDKDNKAGWFFAGRKGEAAEAALINEHDELAQPYALIRNPEDEARLKKHFEEEERIKIEEERKRIELEENKKKKGSWFFFAKEDEEGGSEESVLDDEKIADALDDLEILAGEVRVSQVKEARHLEKAGGSQRFRDDGEQDLRETVSQIVRKFGRTTSHLSAGAKECGISPLLSQTDDSQSPGLAARRKRMSGKQKITLSRFELPLVSGDDDEIATDIQSKSLSVLPGGSGRNLNGGNGRNLTSGSARNMSTSFSSLGMSRRMQDADDTAVEVSPTHEDIAKVEQQAESNISSQKYQSISPPPKASDITKQGLIVDTAKRDARWRLNQTLINHLIRSYHSSMAEIDGVLPGEDEFDVLAGAEESVQEQFQGVRNNMLEDGNFSEREVAAFFEGFALLSVKANALQSQLEALKAVNRAEAEERKLQYLSPECLSNDDVLKEAQKIILIKSMLADSEASSETKVLLRQLEVSERKRIKLEKELLVHGVVFPEHIPFEEAKGKLERISRRMDEIDASDSRRMTKRRQADQEEERVNLESDKKKYIKALSSSDAWIKREDEWEAKHAGDNLDALRRIRRHMPVYVTRLNENQMTIEKTPNGKLLPKRLAKKFCETNILQLIRTHPDAIDRMHPSILENLRSDALMLSERRALYAHLKELGPRWRAAADDESVNRKWLWLRMLKQQFKEALDIYQRHCEEFGPPENHPYATRANPTKGCPFLGKQCPLKADKLFDYAIDYGFPEDAVYGGASHLLVKKQSKSSNTQESVEHVLLKKAFRRSEILKNHYSGRVLQVALANGSCEAMDKIMDRMENLQYVWIEDRFRCEQNKRITDERRRIEMGAFATAVRELKLALPPFAERSGMQLTGNKESNARQPDDRSPVELGLCEEVWEHADDFFAGIEFRVKQLGVKESDIRTEIDQLRELIDELHDRNMNTLNELGVRYPEPSRKLIKRKEIEKEVCTKLEHDEADPSADAEMHDAPNHHAEHSRVPAPEPSRDQVKLDESMQGLNDVPEHPSPALGRSMRRISTSFNARGRMKREDTLPDPNDENSAASPTVRKSRAAEMHLSSSTLLARRTLLGQSISKLEPEPIVTSLDNQSDETEQAETTAEGADASSKASPDPEPFESAAVDKGGEDAASSTLSKPSPGSTQPMTAVAEDTPLSAQLSPGSNKASAHSRDAKLTKTRAALDALRAKNAARTRSSSLRESSVFENGADTPNGATDEAADPNSDSKRKSALLCERSATSRASARDSYTAGKSPGRERIAAGKSPGRERYTAGKSPARERIAAGKSPARERIAELRGRLAAKSPGRERLAAEAAQGGVSGADAAERLAAIEARREKMRASIAARKKGREEAANAAEFKSDA